MFDPSPKSARQHILVGMLVQIYQHVEKCNVDLNTWCHLTISSLNTIWVCEKIDYSPPQKKKSTKRKWWLIIIFPIKTAISFSGYIFHFQTRLKACCGLGFSSPTLWDNMGWSVQLKHPFLVVDHFPMTMFDVKCPCANKQVVKHCASFLDGKITIIFDSSIRFSIRFNIV